MIPHNLPTFSALEQKATNMVLARGWVSQGPEVTRFEDELCNFFELPHGHALVVSSGTAALYLSLWILKAYKKRIGLPVYACSALRNAVGLVGARPIYFDCDLDSPNLNLSSVGDIDILVAPSMFGIPVQISHNYKFKIIEDIAQSFGAISNSEKIGLRGDVGICSFYATKMMTSGGQGGAIISRDKTLIDELRDYINFDCRQDDKLRFNFQMTDIQATIGRIQLKKIPNFINRRQEIFDLYLSHGLKLLSAKTMNDIPVRYRAVLRCNNQRTLIDQLEAGGVRAIIPINKWELLDSSKIYPNAEYLTASTLSIPIYPSLSDQNILDISNLVKEFL